MEVQCVRYHTRMNRVQRTRRCYPESSRSHLAWVALLLDTSLIHWQRFLVLRPLLPPSWSNYLLYFISLLNQSACGLSTGLSSLVVGRVQYVRYQYRYRNLVRIRTRTPTYDTFIRKVDFGESAFKMVYKTIISSETPIM